MLFIDNEHGSQIIEALSAELGRAKARAAGERALAARYEACLRRVSKCVDGCCEVPTEPIERILAEAGLPVEVPF